jgi:hypothetical protein
MIRSILIGITVVFPIVAHCETIVELINKGNIEYMRSLHYVQPGIVPDIVNSFQRINKLAGGRKLVFLRIADGNQTGITDGNTVVVHHSVEMMSELQRSFIIAHEYGHIALNHTALKLALYQKYLPGQVTEANANIANHIVGPELRTLSHKVELQADSYALKVLVNLGWTRGQVVDMFLGMERTPDSTTHPSSARRVQNLLRTPLP